MSEADAARRRHGAPTELPLAKGRAAQINPPTRFGDPLHLPDLEHVEHDAEYLASLHDRPTEYFADSSRTAVTHNDSPDIPFTFSLNPYRGCSHGCSYCYARNSHEFLGLSAGLDFETKILVKHDAASLFRDFLCDPKWRPESIVLSGVTDPYQPAERAFRITRACLEVALEAQQPVSIITKNALVLRDLDLLQPLAAANLVHVNVSVTSLDRDIARTMEPRTSAPAARLRAIRELSSRGVPVRALLAPVVPGLTDSELPALLAAVKDAGAAAAGYMLVRLPQNVAPVFLDWLRRAYPDRAAKVEGRIRSVRGGKLNRSKFGERMRGTGEVAEQIDQLFQLFVRKHGLDGDLPPYNCNDFRPPRSVSGQGWLF